MERESASAFVAIRRIVRANVSSERSSSARATNCVRRAKRFIFSDYFSKKKATAASPTQFAARADGVTDGASEELKTRATAGSMASATTETLERWCASTKGWPTMRREWFELASEALTTTSGNGIAATAMTADFNVCATGGPLASTSTRGARARGRFIAQCDEWLDASRDGRERYSNERCGNPRNGRCLKLSLTDGKSRYVAYEYGTPVEVLNGSNMRAGMKLCLVDPYVDADGAIWLENETVVVLGGSVRRLEEARKRVLEVYGAPNRPGMGSGNKDQEATRRAWEGAAFPSRRAEEPVHRIEAPRVVEPVVESVRVVPATQTEPLAIESDDEMDIPVDNIVEQAMARRQSERSSVPASSSRGSQPLTIQDVETRMISGVTEGSWITIAAIKAARAKGAAEIEALAKNGPTMVFCVVTRVGNVEMNETQTSVKCRVKLMISDHTGSDIVILRGAQLEKAIGATAQQYKDASEADRARMTESVTNVFAGFCGKMKLHAFTEKFLAVQRTLVLKKVGSSVVDAFRNR